MQSQKECEALKAEVKDIDGLKKQLKLLEGTKAESIKFAKEETKKFEIESKKLAAEKKAMESEKKQLMMQVESLTKENNLHSEKNVETTARVKSLEASKTIAEEASKNAK